MCPYICVARSHCCCGMECSITVIWVNLLPNVYSGLSDTCCNSAHLFHELLREMQKSSAVIVSFSVLVVLTAFALFIQFFHWSCKHLKLPGPLEFRVLLLWDDPAFLSSGLPLLEVFFFVNMNIDFCFTTRLEYLPSSFYFYTIHVCIISVGSCE